MVRQGLYRACAHFDYRGLGDNGRIPPSAVAQHPRKITCAGERSTERALANHAFSLVVKKDLWQRHLKLSWLAAGSQAWQRSSRLRKPAVTSIFFPSCRSNVRIPCALRAALTPPRTLRAKATPPGSILTTRFMAATSSPT